MSTTPKRFDIPGEATPKEILEAIDRWAVVVRLARPGENIKLWNILTALRGPDSDDLVLKTHTTAVVRALSLPVLARLAGAGVATEARNDPAAFCKSALDMCKSQGVAGTHFAFHIWNALDALVRSEDERG